MLNYFLFAVVLLQVRLWDAVTGDTLVEYRGHDNFVFCVDQHEHMVVTGSFDETVKIWDVRADPEDKFMAVSSRLNTICLNTDSFR